MFGGEEFATPSNTSGASRTQNLSRPQQQYAVEHVEPVLASPRVAELPETAAEVAGPASIRTLLSARRRSSIRVTGLIPTSAHGGSSAGITPTTPPPHLALRARLTEEYTRMRIRDLKSRLSEAGVCYTGVAERQELVQLLVEHDIAQAVDGRFVGTPARVTPSTPVIPQAHRRPSLMDVPPLEDMSVQARGTISASGLAALEAAVSRAAAASDVAPDEPGVWVTFSSDGVSFDFSAFGSSIGQVHRTHDADDAHDFLHKLAMMSLGYSSDGQEALSAATSVAAVSPTRHKVSVFDTRLQLCQACVDGDVARLRTSLSDASVVTYFNSGCGLEGLPHPLLTCATAGHVDMLHELLLAGFIDGTHISSTGLTALHAACEHRHLPVVTLLANSAASKLSLNAAAGADGVTPLWCAAARNFSEAVHVLAGAGAIVDAVSSSSQTTPLWEACSRGYGSVVVALLARGADPDVRRLTDDVGPLWIACANGHADAVGALLSSSKLHDTLRLPATASKLSPFRVAATLGHVKCARLLYAAGACASSDEEHAAVHGNLHLVKYFV